MKPVKITYKCLKKISDKCWGEWTKNGIPVNGVKDFDTCDPCYEQMCEDEREALSDLD